MKKLLNYVLLISLCFIATQSNCFAQPKSMYIKNATGCPVQIMLRGHGDISGPMNTSCALVSSVFSVGAWSDVTFNDVTVFDCSSCSPQWSGAPYGLATGGTDGWDGAYLRAFCVSPPACAVWTGLGPCFGSGAIIVAGCTSISAAWVYDAINDQWEVAIY